VRNSLVTVTLWNRADHNIFAVVSSSSFMVALCNRETIYIFMLWFVMVALCNRETIYIFMLWFVLLSSSSFFFPRLISAAGDCMFTILWHMVWP